MRCCATLSMDAVQQIYQGDHGNKMRIALASVRMVNRNIRYNLSQMEYYMVNAQRKGAGLVCFGETFLQGFDALTWCFETDQAMAISTDSNIFAEICGMSIKHGIDVLFGYVELDGDSIYSSCALVSSGKLYHNYRRISKGWKEYTKTDEHYREGDTVEVFYYKEKKCVIALCGDLWDYPERFDLGEDLLLWPVYVSWTAEEWESGTKAEYAEQAGKCCPNTLYVNSICDCDAYGCAAFFEKGTVKKELPISHEGLLFVEV